jgi:CRP-like cAMP-binding protein
MGQDYYAVASGSVTVTVRGELVRTMHRGDGFGEIGLLADVPRTATVRAVDEVEVFAIDRGRFLTAVTGHDASRHAAWGIAQSWSHDPLADQADGG